MEGTFIYYIAYHIHALRVTGMEFFDNNILQTILYIRVGVLNIASLFKFHNVG